MDEDRRVRVRESSEVKTASSVRTVVFATVGSLGDIFPYLTIARRLKRRGFRCVLAAGRMHREVVEATGVEFHEIRPDLTNHEKVPEWIGMATHPRRASELIIRRMILPFLRETYDDLEQVVEQADCVVAHPLSYAAKLAAERHGVPLVVAALQPSIFFSSYDPPVVARTPTRGALRALGHPFYAIVFTLGSLAVMNPGRFFSESVAAVRRLRERAVLLAAGGEPGGVDEAGSIFTAGYVPHSRLFPRAAAVVHQGGIGTTAEALRSGKPQLVVPFANDQPDNAHRVVRLGVGRTLSQRRYRSGRVASELETLLADRAYAEGAAQVAEELGREHGVERACDALEACIARSEQIDARARG